MKSVGIAVQVEVWLKSKHDTHPATNTHYRHLARHLAEWGPRRLDAINVEEVEQWRDALVAAGALTRTRWAGS